MWSIAWCTRIHLESVEGGGSITVLSRRKTGSTNVMAKTVSTTMSSRCECKKSVMFEPYVVACDTAAKRYSEKLSTAISTAIMRVVIAVESPDLVL